MAGVLEAEDRAEAEDRLAVVGTAFRGRRATEGLRVIGSCSDAEGVGLGLNLGEGKGKARADTSYTQEEDGTTFPDWVNLQLSPQSPYPTIAILPSSKRHLDDSNITYSTSHTNGRTHYSPASPPPRSPPSPSQRCCPNTARPLPITTVLYTPPSRSQLQFFSLTPLQLDLNSFTSRQPRRRRRSVSSVVAVAEQETAKVQSERAKLVAKLKRTARLDFTSPTEGEEGLAGGIVDLAEVVDWVSGAAGQPLVEGV